MDKKLKIIVAVALIAVILVSGIFWVPALSRTLEPSRGGPTTLATNVEQITPQYLPDMFPYPFQTSSSGSVFESATRIFLVSATSYYGYINETVKSLNGHNIINKGDPIFIINVTLRNDYNSENPLPLSKNNYAYIFVTATLYSQNNGTITAKDVSPTNPQVAFLNAYIGLNSGATSSVEIWLSTSNRNINHYEINLDVFGIPPA